MVAWIMRSFVRSYMHFVFMFGLFAGPMDASAQAGPRIAVHQDEQGFYVSIDEEPTLIRGMNWGYVPIGQNYSYDFWAKPKPFIQKVLDKEMALLRAMGVNAIRQYVGIPPEWVTYIYEKFGIYTMVNHTVGRYGFLIDGAWVPRINYADEKTRATIKADVLKYAEMYKDVPGVMMWLLGNENNYGLEWQSFEIENLPKDEQHRARAVHLYSMMGEILSAIKSIDGDTLLAIANGDLQYLDLVKKHCVHMDVFGSNVYRGISSRDLFDRVRDELGVPFVYTEFGADAYDAKAMREDGATQAKYLLGQWQEIYEHTYPHGKSGVAVGGFIFQWSDGWWKYKQEENLSVHDTTASWSNGGYPEDWMPDGNNMNEEWFGINGKTANNDDGTFDVQPREAYFALQKAFALNPYDMDATPDKIETHFAAINPTLLTPLSMAYRADAKAKELSKAYLSDVRFLMSVHGSNRTDAPSDTSNITSLDHMQSLYSTFTVQPSKKLRANATLNVIGNVAQNRIDELFYENRAQALELQLADGTTRSIQGGEQIKLYNAEFEWETPWGQTTGYFRTGHFHWGYEGDLFGFYPEAFYGPNIDIYNVDVPIGIEIEGKQALEGLSIAAGPQVFWGANPMVMAKYFRSLGAVDVAVLHREDVAQMASGAQTRAVAEPRTRRTALNVYSHMGPLNIEWGGLWSGSDKLGWDYISARPTGGRGYLDSGYLILEDKIYWLDTLGTKLRLEYKEGPVSMHAQGGYKGLVADAGIDQRINITGWQLKEPASGNNYHALAGAAWRFGFFELAPQVLYQKPLEAPLPTIEGLYSAATNVFYPDITPRDRLNSPFLVLDNREMLAAELLFSFDPTPGSWMWMWDNPLKEDAHLAYHVRAIYRHQPTTRDATIGFAADGSLNRFHASPPAQDVWDLGVGAISNNGALKTISNIYVGENQTSGFDDRLIFRYGADIEAIYGKFRAQAWVKFNDWGPFDYYRDYNLTFPFQGFLSGSYELPVEEFGDTTSRIGISAYGRTFDAYSPKFNALRSVNEEYEIQTFWELGL